VSNPDILNVSEERKTAGVSVDRKRNRGGLCGDFYYAASDRFGSGGLAGVILLRRASN
jgi:hypothetical protein